MARVYLGASYGRKAEMRDCRDDIAEMELGIVTSRWIDRSGTHDVTSERLNNSPDDCAKYALQDLEDMAASNCFILFTGDNKSTGGRHTEFGVALRMKNIVAIYIIGPRENVFHTLESSKIYQFPDWKTFVKSFKEAKAEFEFGQLVEKFLGDLMDK